MVSLLSKEIHAAMMAFVLHMVTFFDFIALFKIILLIHYIMIQFAIPGQALYLQFY